MPSSIYSVISISDLKAIDTTQSPPNDIPNGFIVNVKGYYWDTDGGGGDFVWHAGDTGQDNGGSIIAPNSGNGRWKRLASPNDPVRAEFFGVARGPVSCSEALTNTTGLNKSPYDHIVVERNVISMPLAQFTNGFNETGENPIVFEPNPTFRASAVFIGNNRSVAGSPLYCKLNSSGGASVVREFGNAVGAAAVSLAHYRAFPPIYCYRNQTGEVSLFSFGAGQKYSLDVWANNTFFLPVIDVENANADPAKAIDGVPIDSQRITNGTGVVTLKTNSQNTLASLDAGREWAILIPTGNPNGTSKWRYMAFSAAAKDLAGVPM